MLWLSGLMLSKMLGMRTSSPHFLGLSSHMLNIPAKCVKLGSRVALLRRTYDRRLLANERSILLTFGPLLPISR